MTTPENITHLEPNEIFVFGSNLNGFHDGGAAKVAEEKFGAEWGIGEGLVGQSYAFPTLGYQMQRMHIEDLEECRNTLYKTARALPAVTFYLTKVGTGIAGFHETEMGALFMDSPENIIKPKGWT